MNFLMNHAPVAGSLAEHVDEKQSSALPQSYGCPHLASEVGMDCWPTGRAIDSARGAWFITKFIIIVIIIKVIIIVIIII